MIDVQVREESGKILQRGRGVGVDKFFEADRQAYPLLGHIVPWADTAFNRSQVDLLVKELERYEADPSIDADGYSFDWLREMCQIALREPHRMLWFVGD